MRRHWGKRRTSIDLSEWFASVYVASREDRQVPPTSLDRQRWHDDVAREGNSRSPVLQMRACAILEDFLCCYHDVDF